MTDLEPPASLGYFAPDEARVRCYAIGARLANLLDVFRPGWQQALLDSPELYLDELFPVERLPLAPELAAGVWEKALESATQSVAQLIRRRSNELLEFRARPGWSLSLTPNTPLEVGGFDPMNVQLVSEKQILHHRYLVTANDDIELELMAVHSLTETHGAHPLFGGLAAVQVTGLSERPKVESLEPSVRVTAPGLRLEMAAAAGEIELTLI